MERPRLGLRAGIASGDSSASDADLQTFNPLFVRGNYFGEAGLLSPQNFVDLFPSLRIKPDPKLTVEGGSTFIGEKILATESTNLAVHLFFEGIQISVVSSDRVSFGHGLASQPAY